MEDNTQKTEPDYTRAEEFSEYFELDSRRYDNTVREDD